MDITLGNFTREFTSLPLGSDYILKLFKQTINIDNYIIYIYNGKTRSCRGTLLFSKMSRYNISKRA